MRWLSQAAEVQAPHGPTRGCGTVCAAESAAGDFTSYLSRSASSQPYLDWGPVPAVNSVHTSPLGPHEKPLVYWINDKPLDLCRAHGHILYMVSIWIKSVYGQQ